MDRSWEYTNRSQTHECVNVEIGTEAAKFKEKEYINGIFVAVYFVCAACFHGTKSNCSHDGGKKVPITIATHC